MLLESLGEGPGPSGPDRPGSATCPSMPVKEKSSGEEQEELLVSMATPGRAGTGVQ